MVSEMTGRLYFPFSFQDLRKDHASPGLLPDSVPGSLFSMAPISLMIPALQ